MKFFEICADLNQAKHTTVRSRHRMVLNHPQMAQQPLLVMIGTSSYNGPMLTNADYFKMVGFTGRMIHPGKRGAIREKEPKALTKLGLDPNHWRAKGIGHGYWRVVAEVDNGK